jgi:choline kinase
MKEDLALVYLVAGISSRFGGKIKSFAKVGPSGETLIEYSLKQALNSRFTKIVFVVGNKTEKEFKKRFGKAYGGIPVYYALQGFDKKRRDKPWGTGEALCVALPLLDCAFVVCNGDDIYGESAFRILTKHLMGCESEATIGYELISVLPKQGSVNRGIISAKNGYVRKIKESYDVEATNLLASKRKPRDLCSMGIFALHSDKLRILDSEVRKFKKKHKSDRKAEFSLPEEISKLIGRKKMKMRFYAATERWVGITNPGDEKIVRKEIIG